MYGVNPENHRQRFRLVRRAVDGAAQHGAVAHGDRHAPLHLHVGELGALLGCGVTEHGSAHCGRHANEESPE